MCGAVARGEVPLRGAKTQPGFHPFANHIRCESFPDSDRGISGMAGRIPSCGGCASPSGAQCRRMTVFCLPGTMPDRGGRNK
ncbi:MAG: hypothetical protein LBK61_07850 [Spirochaetaceae bacterium]|nr:hypothetical protein [Spirochaetaceae bacterium]